VRILAVSDEVADPLWTPEVKGGLGGSRCDQPGPNQYSERRHGRRVRRLVARARRRRPSRPVDGLIAHAPIAGLDDAGAGDPAHPGFEAFPRLVSALHPRLFLHGQGGLLSRAEIAWRWYNDEYRRVVRMLRAANLVGPRTEAEAYLRVAAERYRLMRTHEWNDEIIARLRSELHD
jgi:hypothetical protein